MKKMLAAAVVGLVALAGCADRDADRGQVGGPGATKPDRGTDLGLGQKENTFSLDAPNLETDLNPGETETISISIDRGENFTQDVRLQFEGAPKGLTVKPAREQIKAGEEEVQVTLQADRDAQPGEHTIKVTGTPAKEGKPATTTFKVQINQPN